MKIVVLDRKTAPRRCTFPVVLFVSLFFICNQLFAGTTHYYLDFSGSLNNAVEVRVQLPPAEENKAETERVLVFPATIPGTYSTLDYGRFISSFSPVGSDGKPMKFTREGNNVFRIKGAATTVTYKVKDSFHNKVRKNKIFEPAGTNIQEGKNLLFNAGGFCCYQRGHEKDSSVVHITYPGEMVAVSAIQGKKESNTSVFYARNYQELVDCPVMVTAPDTSSFWVSNCHVSLAVFNESGRKVSEGIRQELKSSMNAISQFFHDTLPVSQYAFIFYIKDYTAVGNLINGNKPGIVKVVKLVSSLAGKGFGALEHGNSSVYFLPDFGENMLLESVKDVAIHEFMHIITPLNLHSECVGNFNYENPVMSRHLWLYEGVTEYFAGLIQVKHGLVSRSYYLNNILRNKIFDSSSFPYKKMSFAEMSENVLKNPYKDQYGRVYTRGAVIAALLDIKIISLTKGSKSLESVVKSLYRKYGQHASFDDAHFFEEFVQASHPGIAEFISKYINGREDLPIREVFQEAGISYTASQTTDMPVLPFTDIKFSKLNLDGKSRVKKVGKKAVLPLQVNDKIDLGELKTSFGRCDTSFLAKGSIDTVHVIRNGQKIDLVTPVEYANKTASHLIFFQANPGADQLFVRRKWLEP